MLGRVTIVLVNYNGKIYLDDFMRSVSQQSYLDIDIVLVDNASEDDSVQWIEKNYPNVRIMRMQRNEGFGQGCNIGIDYAIREGTDYILLLNTDTVLETNLVEELVRNIDNNTVVTATIYCGDKNNKKFWYAGGKIDFETANVNQLLYSGSENKVYEVDFISGCCMMFHRSIIERIGGFDRKFYLYYEDADFCVRLKQHGIQMKYITTTSLWHKVGGSSLGGNETSCSTQYYVTRNRLLFAEKYPSYFISGNLEILRKILQEYAFFDGADNEQYEMFVKAAVSDYFKEKFEKGFYGRTLLEEHFFVQDGLGEREEDGEKFWYCARDTRASISVVNSQKRNIIYNVSFDIENINCPQDSDIVVEIEGIEAARYKFTKHIEVRMFLRPEQSKKISIICSKRNEDLDIGHGDKIIYFQLLNINVEEQDKKFFMGNGFMPEESDGQSSWYWSGEPTGEVYLVNDKDTVAVEEVAFEVVPYRAGEGKEVTIYQDGVKVAGAGEGRRSYLRVAVPPQRITSLEIRTDYQPYEEEGCRRCFNVHNMTVTRMDRNYYMGNSFMPEESDGQSSWYWSGEPTGEVYLVNDKDTVAVEEVAFEVVPYKIEEGKRIVINEGEIGEVQAEANERIYIWSSVPPRSISKILVNANYQICKVAASELCFSIYNLTVQEMKKSIKYNKAFYSPETNGRDVWRWCREKEAEILFVLNAEKDATISFAVSCDKQYLEEPLQICIDGNKKFEIIYNKKFCIPIGYDVNRPIHKVSIKAKHLPYKINGDDRTFTFQLLNFTIEEMN